MDHCSLREQLVSAIGFVIGQSRSLLRDVVRKHVSDDEQRLVAQRVVQHLEMSGFEVDEAAQALRKRPSAAHHSTPAGPPTSMPP